MYGLTGSYTSTVGGDSYGSFGIGTPGPSFVTGYNATGEFTGLNIDVTLPLTHTGVTFDPVDQNTIGIDWLSGVKPDASITYTVDLGAWLASAANNVNQFAQDFVQTYYPEPTWNPDYQPQQ